MISTLIQELPTLNYTEKVFAESIRFYPLAWAIGRQVVNDCKIGKYIILACSSILISQYLCSMIYDTFQNLNDLIQNSGIQIQRHGYQDLAIFHLEVDKILYRRIICMVRRGVLVMPLLPSIGRCSMSRTSCCTATTYRIVA
jgi:hypothetical protein